MLPSLSRETLREGNMLKVTFRNPRLVAEFSDWPSGRDRVRCRFEVHHDAKKGYRVSRTTTGKPKFTTYGGPACVVDGSDGRTYVLQYAGGGYEKVKIMRHDFLDATGDVGVGAVFKGMGIPKEDDAYEALMDLIREAK